MKSLYKVLFAVALMPAASSCSKFLDINENPNSPTKVNADAILASALSTTAANYTGQAGDANYNSYASMAAGYWTRSGTISGFAPEQNTVYSTNYYSALFNATYDNLNDYNLMQAQAAAYPNHAAIARIMKVYNYLLLVDEYGDIPYSQALLAAANTSPAYDKAADIYKDFIVQLKGAVTDINAATAGTKVGAEDVVFAGNMTKWKQFANSLRLRILLRESSTNDAALNSYVATEMKAVETATDGFITADVVVQPGYASNSGQQNPFYNRYGRAVGSIPFTPEYSYILPTNFYIRQDTLNKDPRISQQFAIGKKPGYGATTYVGSFLGQPTPPLFTGTTVGSRFKDGGSFLRSGAQATPLMFLSEHLFSKSEAELRGLFTQSDATAKADYLAGIRASFNFTFGSAAAGAAPYAAYLAANTTNGLVTWEATSTFIAAQIPEDAAPTATTGLLTTPRTVGKAEKIIYQKYLSETTFASVEGWDDYRRTGLPKLPISPRSQSPRADKLATRLLYPQGELSTNAGNVPAGVDQYTKIFWDVLD